MKARAIIPGHLYAVTLYGRTWVVFAKHPCDAICQMSEVIV